jgi:iron complex transport system permease protein
MTTSPQTTLVTIRQTHESPASMPPSKQNQAAREHAVTLQIRHTRRRSLLRSIVVSGLLSAALAALFYSDLAFGHEVYSLSDIISVVEGWFTATTVPGLSFTIGQLRAPRVIIGTLCGMAFGLAGASFQNMLRNLMASPDIIGITAGANTAAVIGIVAFGLSGLSLSGFALIGGLAAAVVIIAMSWEAGRPNVAKLILMGIGLAAGLNAVTSWVLIRSNEWDMQAAQRRLTGSLADASWPQVTPMGLILVIAGIWLVCLNRHIDMLRFDFGLAAGLGVRVGATQITVLLLAVTLLSSATATSGPIAFVSFLAGPIAARLAGPEKPAIGRAGLVGACLVLASDIVAQHLPGARVPVGAVTSLIGGPILVIMMIRKARTKEL